MGRGALARAHSAAEGNLHEDRHLSISGQQFVPRSDRKKILLPLAFCRACGAEYYSVWKATDTATGRVHFRPRELSDRVDDPAEGEAGFLHRDPDNPWPEDPDEIVSRLPDEWLEEHRGRQRVRNSLHDDVPQPILIEPNGNVGASGLTFWFTHTPFRFCQNCGVSYRVRRRASDYGQLATLASGGRSTATTILSISSVRFLRQEPTLQDFARKLLSFTDNRQDASLQAGHFNDFVARELLDRAEVQRMAVLCPPHLAEQWQDELRDKFHIEAELVLSSTARRLDRVCGNRSVFDVFPYTIVSLDYIKSESRRDDFIRACPELVIVDEAHTCTSSAQPGRGSTRQQRHEVPIADASDHRRARHVRHGFCS